MRYNLKMVIAFALVAIVPWVSKAAAPDLTAPGVIAGTDTTRTYNLGPTGMRGWLYNKEGSGADGTISALSRQILVTAVGTNTPAYGILATNDVILGVSTGAGNAFTNFTSDARKSLGWAITAAEAGDGVMNIRRWRAGVTNDVSIQLRVMGAYSPTAPYDCPKSALILSNACAIIANRSFNAGIPGDPVLGLALLAGGYTNVLPKVQTYARAIAPSTLALRVAPGQSARDVDVWANGYKGIFLAEYYLLTGDTNVLHGIDEYAVSLSQAQGRYGTMCHRGSLQNADGSLHGTMPPYGPVNQGALSASLAIALGKKCMVESGRAIDTEIPAALYRSAQFFGFYAGKGSIPYGEHEPWYEHDGSNGKDGQAALLFALAGGRPSETEYFTRLTTASYDGREYGHTGQGFSYLWSALGVNVGGTNAVAAYLAKVQWHLDLSRRCDGSFAYDGAEQYGGSEVSDYWAVGGNNDYYGIDPTASYVLTYGVAKQKLYITGKNANPTNTLSTAAVTNAIWSGTFKLACSGYDTNQLMAALGEYDPLVRNWAAAELGSRSNLNVATFIDLASSSNPLLRQSACQVLGVLKNTSALTVLGQRLSDPDVWVRAKAANALRNFSSAASSQLTTMLTAFVSNATDPNVVAWEDPIQIANAHLSFGLFGDAVYGGGNVATFTAAASKSLLYPAVQVGLRQPDSNPRFGVANFAYTYLTLADVQALTLDLIDVAALECQADTMWSMDPRGRGILTLAKYSVAEAIPLALSMLITPEGFGWGDDGFKVPALNALKTYGDAARWTLPTLRSYLTEWDVGSAEYVALNSAIASIEAATSSPAGLTNLFPVAYPQVVAVTNAKSITLTGFSWRTNAVTFFNVTAPSHGALTGTPPNLTYTPEVGYSGMDRFTFQVRDALTNSDPATVCLVVGGAGAGLKGDYFNNKDFTAPVFSRIDPQVNFDWGTGSPSNTVMGSDTFSVRWSGRLTVPETGNYMFSTLASDGVRLYVDGALLIDDFVDQSTHWKDSPAIALTEGQQVELQMDYYENTGSAVAKLKWTGPSFAGSNGVIITKEWLVDASEITNRPAIAYSQSLTLLQNTSQAVLLQGVGTPVAYTIATLPLHGTLSGTPPTLTYTPETDYSGTDSFTFTVNNGLSNSSPATVSLAIWVGLPADFSWKNATPGNWSTSANWTNAAGAAVAPDAAGNTLYRLSFMKSGTYSVTNDLSNGFLLNQLNVGAAVTFGGANGLAFSANGALLPAINQTSASAIKFGTPLELRAMTTLGGTGGGAVTFSGLLSGSGGLTINNTGALQMYNVNNTYTGGTIINAGTVSFPVAGTGAMTPYFGTGPVTLNSHGTLSFNRTYLTNSIFLNGGTVSGGNSFSSVFSGPVTLTDITTFDFGSTGGFNISGNITGPGGLRTVGSSTWHLSGTNSYTGPTLVEDGMLTYDKSSAVGGSALSISNGAMVNLSYTGTRQIASLTLGGVLQPNNTYGSSASPATIKNDTYFSGTGTVTSGMTNQTITFGPLPAKVYGDAPFALTATASSGLTVSYASSDPTVASVSGNIVTILKAGTTVITATQAGNIVYFPAAPVAQTLTVNKALQTITFSALPAKVYGDAPFALTATAGSGLAVSYASSDPAVASVSGNTVSILKVGATTITASQTGGVNYNAATPVQQTLTVNKLPVLLAGTRIYDGTTAAAAADLSITNTVAGDSLTLSGSATLAGKDAGAQPLTSGTGYATQARVQSASGSTGASAAPALVVNLINTPANGNTLVAVISTRGTSTNRVNGITQTGTTWSRATQAANTNGTTTEIWYASNVSGASTNITISQASVRSVAVVAEYSGILSASPLDQIANATGTSAAAATGTTPTTTESPELWIGGIGLSGSAYTLGPALNGFAAVTNAQSSSGTTADNAKVYMLESITNATGLAASGGAITGTQTLTIAQRGTATSANGTTSVTPALPSGLQQNDLMIACVVAYGTSVSTPSTLSGWTLIKNAASLGNSNRRRCAIMYKLAGASESAPTFATTGAAASFATLVAFSNVDTASPLDVAVASLPAIATGTVADTAVSGGAITTVTPNARVIMFGMAASISSGTGATFTDATWTTATSPGALTELFDLQGNGTGNNATSIGAAWAIKTTVGNTGAASAALSAAMRNGGLLLALRPVTLPTQWSGAIATFKTTSTSSLTLVGAASTNYTLSGMSGTMVVTPKPLTLVDGGVASKIYDATLTAALTNGTLLAAEAVGAGNTSDGKPYAGDAVGVTLSGVFDTKEAGEGKAVTSTSSLTGAQAGNYSLTQPADLTATIMPKALTVTGAIVESKIYDGSTNALFSAGALLSAEEPGAGSTADNKPYSGDALGLALSGLFASKNVGAGIAVTSTSMLTGAQAGNYMLTQPAGLTGAITPHALSVTAANQNKVRGELLVFGSGSTLFTSDGLQLDETIGSVTLACAGGAAGAAEGDYPITPSAATGGTFNPDNYAVSYVDGTLTVSILQAAQTITFAPLAAKAYGDTPFELTATASSGLPVSYNSSDPTVASVEGSAVTILKTGTSLITASQAGDANYLPASPVAQMLTVNPAAQTIIFGALPEKTYGDALFELTATASSGLIVSYASSDTNVAIVVSNLVTILNAGATVITATQAGDANRSAATPVPQTLTVNKVGQIIAFDLLLPKNYGDVPFALLATASSGLTVSFASSDTNVATVAGSTVTIRKAGSTVITASQEGDANRSAATPVPRTLTINKITPVLTWDEPAAIIIGTALSSRQLNASSGGVAGVFTYMPPVGTVLPLGVGQMLSASFVPTDTEMYNIPEDIQVSLTVTATFLAEDFEHEWSDNALARTTNQWTSSTIADQSSITNPAIGYAPLPLGISFPLIYDHTLLRRVLKVDTQGASLATPTLDAAFTSSKVYVDMMAKFGVCLDFPAAVSNDVTAKASVFLRTNGGTTNLVVFHGQMTLNGFGAPIFTPVSNGFDPNAWYRLTITLDATTNNIGAEAFSVRINGEPLVSPAAYSDTWKTQIFSESYTPDGGSWFLSASRRLGSSGTNLTTLTGLTFDGEGFVDDLVVTYTNPTFVPGTVIMLALSTGSGGEAWMGF